MKIAFIARDAVDLDSFISVIEEALERGHHVNLYYKPKHGRRWKGFLLENTNLLEVLYEEYKGNSFTIIDELSFTPNVFSKIILLLKSKILLSIYKFRAKNAKKLSNPIHKLFFLLLNILIEKVAYIGKNKDSSFHKKIEKHIISENSDFIICDWIVKETENDCLMLGFQKKGLRIITLPHGAAKNEESSHRPFPEIFRGEGIVCADEYAKHAIMEKNEFKENQIIKAGCPQFDRFISTSGLLIKKAIRESKILKYIDSSKHIFCLNIPQYKKTDGFSKKRYDLMLETIFSFISKNADKSMLIIRSKPTDYAMILENAVLKFSLKNAIIFIPYSSVTISEAIYYSDTVLSILSSQDIPTLMINKNLIFVRAVWESWNDYDAIYKRPNDKLKAENFYLAEDFEALERLMLEVMQKGKRPAVPMGEPVNKFLLKNLDTYHDWISSASSKVLDWMEKNV